MSMRKKIFFAFVLLLCAIPAACAATPSLELTPEDLVRLLNGVAGASESWPLGANGEKTRIPNPAYATKDGKKTFTIRLNPIATIAGPVDPKSGHMQSYAVDLLLSDAETIARLSAPEPTSPTKEAARMYGAVCASLLLLNADTADEFAGTYNKCKNFFAVDAGVKNKVETLRVNRHVSMRFSYTDKSPLPYILRRIEVFPAK
ncbi:hypothetical protein LJC31_05300 [Synergistaceae bacterium OttesenSCG-928-I11]|nr:hypothetical protein [Synergistaceae bacterium OttesenSCG-928-I11]